jgi:hypothetical protein
MIFSNYQPKNVFLPLEAHTLSFLIQNNMSSLSFSNIEDITADYCLRLGALSCFTKDLINKYKEAAIFSLQTYTNKPKSAIIHDILGKTSTWNSYVLSILFLVLLRDIFKPHNGIPTNVGFFQRFFQLLTDTIHPDPLQRPTILQNISLFNDILYSVCDYDEIISLFP